MSSGVEADIALDAAVIASLGLVRVMGGAAGLAAAGAGALAALAEGRAEAQAQRLQEAQELEKTVGEALDRTARIAALAQSARHHGLAVGLPTPIELAGRSADELAAWIIQADAQIAPAEESLATAIAEAATGRIFDAASTPLKARPQEGRSSAVPRPPTSPDDLTRVLKRLAPDAAGDDRRSVTEAAEQVVHAPTASEAEGRLTEVRIRIQDANERARERRDGRAAALRFLRELEAHPAAESVRPRLGEVADGTRPFDEALRAEAARLVEDAQRQAEHRYVTEVLRETFGALGYEVGDGFETLTAQDGEAVLTRGDWPQHAVKVRVDDARQVRMALLRTEPAESDEQRRLDVEREEQWCASFDAARERLSEAGVHADVRWRVEPGTQRLPVAQRQRSRRQQDEQRRELGR
ncbi:response regulator receiver protein [Actinoallomurus purpureus]|uniref:response regulator receiver protein n=1 Tax=Actinoallomurus purpureus TaxID=478114 RepID=UPI00209209CD|nr:response regulator receiver protein [Actinoallomurus purpureus]MCO6006613.1 response regulator receiver protein [Actinoallomurus purpureus]